MSINNCENVQTALAESDLRYISRELASHVETCPGCAAYLKRLQRLQDDLAGFGAGDIPEDVVEDLETIVQTTIQNITTQPGTGAPVTKSLGLYGRWASGFAVLFVCIGVVTLLQPRLENSGLFSSAISDIGSEFHPEEIVIESEELFADEEAVEAKPSPAGRLSKLTDSTGTIETKSEIRKGIKKESRKKSQLLAFRAPLTEPASSAQPEPEVSEKTVRGDEQSRQEGLADIVAAREIPQYRLVAPVRETASVAQIDDDVFAKTGKFGENYSGPVGDTYELRRGTKDRRIGSAEGRPALVMSPSPKTEATDEVGETRVDTDASSNEHAQQLAANYLREYDRVDSLNVQPATGYWANTYLPGDPNMRLLQARLASWDRSGVSPVLHGDVSLEKSTSAFHQPFDPPSNAALAVYLNSDHSAVQGLTRMRVQVGLQATERFSGHRPAMNVGLVIDATSIGADALASVKALLRAMAQAVQPGDRFSLTVAGSQGGVWIKPQEFRLGHVQVALDRLFTTQESPGLNVTTSLLDALHAATDLVQRHDDPSAVLGSSSIMLITASSLSHHIEQLEALAHRNATNGITLSVVPLAGAVSIEDVDRLVLAGQGHRRILSSPEDAGQLVSAELLSSSRAVARAVRLRIRLSPGVKLVQVLGTHRLDEPHAQRVREAERSIDRRLSRNFGIVTDRGEDEEGIQIVIPSFFAGDSHVILLDVVAQGSGSIADVTVRYKDLLYLRNGVARANLNLPAGENTPGTLEYKVTKNLLGLTLAQHARRAGDLLAKGDAAAAVETLQYVLNLYKGMRHIIPNWYEDQELMKDEALLSRYLALLQSAGIREQASYVADSLRLSGYRKLLTGNNSL